MPVEFDWLRVTTDDDCTKSLLRTARESLAESGAGVFALRDAFGWKGLAMPQRYVKRVQQSARDAVEQHGARTAAIMAGKPKADLGRIESAHKGKRNG